MTTRGARFAFGVYTYMTFECVAAVALAKTFLTSTDAAPTSFASHRTAVLAKRTALATGADVTILITMVT